MGVLELTLQALVAFAAAYAGARWALANTKRERIFDRLACYQRTLGSLERMQLRSRQLQEALHTNDLQAFQNHASKAMHVIEAFRVCFAEAGLFASDQARQQLGRLSDTFDQEFDSERKDIASLPTGFSLRLIIPTEQKRIRAIMDDRLAVLSVLVGQARNELTTDGRRWIERESEGGNPMCLHGACRAGNGNDRTTH